MVSQLNHQQIDSRKRALLSTNRYCTLAIILLLFAILQLTNQLCCCIIALLRWLIVLDGLLVLLYTPFYYFVTLPNFILLFSEFSIYDQTINFSNLHFFIRTPGLNIVSTLVTTEEVDFHKEQQSLKLVFHKSKLGVLSFNGSLDLNDSQTIFKTIKQFSLLL